MNGESTNDGAKNPVRVAVAVVEHEGHYLIGQRPAGVPLAGLWEFPGGKLQHGETSEEAAVRECHEETGLSVAAYDRYEVVTERYTHATVEVTFVACRVIDAAVTARTPFRWVRAVELATYEFPAANAKLLRQLASKHSRS